MFSVEATGNEPLSYKWEWKPAEREEWQPCDAQGSTLTIPSVLKSNKGSYRCVISNCAGEQTSNLANLTVGKDLELLGIVVCLIITRSTCCIFLPVAEPPRIITHPQELKALRKTTAKFTTRAVGTEPLKYKWQWKPAAKKWRMWGRSEEWQPYPAEWSDGSTLTIPSVEKSNEGSYRCVISNYAGSQISNSAELEVRDSTVITVQIQ